MSKPEQKQILGSHAEGFINAWPAICKIIKDAGIIHQDEESHFGLNEVETLSHHQIITALRSPYQMFLRRKIQEYAKIAYLRVELTLRQSDAFSETRSHHYDQSRIPEKLLTNLNLNQLDQLQKELDELSINHYHELKELHNQWMQPLIQHINEAGVSINEMEWKELAAIEPIDVLQKRFIDLGLEFPEFKDEEMNFSFYSSLKTQIAIYSALSRQHLPHGTNDIKKIMKKIKFFEIIRRDEKEHYTKQQTETSQLISKIIPKDIQF